MKVGDPKDNIRRDIRTIFQLVVSLYPASRLFVCLSNGIKSKVNKARQECLEEMGSLIGRFGISVCQPTPQVALKQMATQIADRDSGVRTSALNSLVSAYAILGEKIWKLIGEVDLTDFYFLFMPF
ncbi:unnamed protein product [Protopolystoma xenopodis]|uniref:XMAP215/Dis1/CLASP TOG domain-containing protein n=1 Tax=Protopolystoma xenopodis TaxID=117903 RepID=A0A3S5A5K6_9PLAT|nr:unnamed protein product [Protopolystoma xenopodis]